jgi:Rrf2 family protein
VRLVQFTQLAGRQGSGKKLFPNRAYRIGDSPARDDVETAFHGQVQFLIGYEIAMRVSAKTEYACIAMLELAAQYGSNEPVRIRRIAERHDVPPRFLVQILLQLKGAGLVASVRGAAGGYHLVKPPQEVSLGQVMEVIEGSSEENSQTSSASPDSPAVKVLMQAWKEVSDVQRKMLDSITLADLLDRAKAQDEQMYHI